MWKVSFLMALSLFPSLNCHAQRNEIFCRRIASLQVVAGDRWMSLPITQLKGGEPIHISFDDLTHEYHRYVYRIEHCEADWTTSDQIFTSDFCEGFSEGNIIEDMEESLNTNVLYTHYHLQIPNDRCRFTMSGNYRISIYDDDQHEEILRACFMVVDPQMGISLKAKTNTDADINGRHQQIDMQIQYGPLSLTNINQQLKTVLLQNGRWDNAVINPKPQFIMSDGLRWEHCKELIFNGGNEYRKFEMLDVTHTTMGLETIGWDGSQYHAYPWIAEPRPSYVYDEDANGSFYIRNSDNIEVHRLSEYLQVHFRLRTPRQSGLIYINGTWTQDQFLPEYQMVYNEKEQLYELELMLKQGYYSYQYLLLSDSGIFEPVPSEGNFYQTENAYQALVYYRGTSDRTDQLVGYAELSKR